MTVNAEREVKLNAPRKFQLPDLHELGLGTVRLPAQSPSTSYFDTEDLRLWQRRVTLRHRIGEDEGTGLWTLKLPGKETRNQLDRTELSWPGSPEEPPSEATSLLRGILRRQILKRVTVLETKRRRVLVREGGSALRRDRRRSGDGDRRRQSGPRLSPDRVRTRREREDSRRSGGHREDADGHERGGRPHRS
jgi:hypothetical protein